jgi:hypothetical protein
MPVNYSTRPNKHVDRELFVDLVGRSLSGTSIDRCAYVSMGGPQMADHIAMYRRNGVSKLYSFDTDENIVLRQKFNAPTVNTVCKMHAAAELPALIDDIKDDLAVDRLVVWFDYTGAKKRGAQLAEFQSLLQCLSSGDIARISLDASLPSEKLKASLPQALKDNPVAATKALLSQEFGIFHPEDFEIEALSDMPRYLTNCVRHLCDRCAEMMEGTGLSFQPMLQTYYVDSMPMFTATILVQNADGSPVVPDGFGYLARTWDDLEWLEVPELSAREKSFLDCMLDRDGDGVNSQLKYNVVHTPQTSRQWDSFKRFHRFLPQFQHVELK